MGRHVVKWMRLPSGDRWLLLGLMLGLPLVTALLRSIGLVRTKRWLEVSSNASLPREPDRVSMERAQRLARLAEIAGRCGFVSATCLRQALLVHWLLRRRGLAPALKLGVRKEAGTLGAHAWVELQGVALGQHEQEHVAFSGLDWASPALR